MRVDLALSRLHDLTDEKAKYFLVPCLIVGNLLRMSYQDLIDRFLYTFRVRNLLEPFFGYDLLRRTSGVRHRFENHFGDFATDFSLIDECDHGRKIVRPNRPVGDVELFVEFAVFQ